VKLTRYTMCLTLLLTNAALAGADECDSISQSKSPPYAITITCKVDCHHIPRFRTIAELIKAGVDRHAAPRVVQGQAALWHRLCPNSKQNSN
jgi:hypothetical protein